MIDGFGRRIDYLRISVTDRCNLRCVYCMPEEKGGGTLAERPEGQEERELESGEILALVRLLAGMGIEKIKLTGGEPLLYPGIENLAGELKQISGISQVTLTTNGILLAEKADALEEAGIDGINLSLDTLDPEVFFAITRRRGFARVMEGFQRILEGGKIPLKVNCVPARIPGQKAEEVAGLARNYPVAVRYIEMMPIGEGRNYEKVGEESMLELLQARYGNARTFAGEMENGPGHYYDFPGFSGKVGFISAVTHKFCSSCNRLRLTSRGFLKTCLQYEQGVDLGVRLRSGAKEEEICRAVEEAVRQKPEGHQFSCAGGEKLERHTMAQIGG